MNGIHIKRYSVRQDRDMEMAMRTSQKLHIRQSRHRLLLVTVLTLVVSAMYPLIRVHADERNRPVRIGVLIGSWGPTPQAVGLRDGLTALGYLEDRDYVLGIRFTQGNREALPAADRELLKLGVDLIFAPNDQSAKAAQRATSQLPIVFATSSDPIGQGLIQSFPRPGGNLTGVADLSLELGPKHLQLFQEMVPGLRRILFPYEIQMFVFPSGERSSGAQINPKLRPIGWQCHGRQHSGDHSGSSASGVVPCVESASTISSGSRNRTASRKCCASLRALWACSGLT